MGSPFESVMLCSCCADGLVVVFGNPPGRRPVVVPSRDRKNKRIPLDADVAATLAGPTGAGRCLGAVLSFSVRSGENPVGQLLSKRICLLRLHPIVLVVMESLRVVFVLLCCVLVFVVPRIKQMACQLLKTLTNQQLEKSEAPHTAPEGAVSVTGLPSARYAGKTR